MIVTLLRLTVFCPSKRRESNVAVRCLHLFLLAIASVVLVGCPSKTRLPAVIEIGSHGDGPGQFDAPMGITTRRLNDSLGDVLFVADYLNRRVSLFNGFGGPFLRSFGDSGALNSQLAGPVGVTVTQTNFWKRSRPVPRDIFIFVSDCLGNRIAKYDLFGRLIKTWGATGSAPGEFNNPMGLDMDFNGRLYVSDSGNNRIQAFDTSGAFLYAWGSTGTDSGKFNGPTDITVIFANDTEAVLIAVADPGNALIQLFSPSGEYRYSITQNSDLRGLGFYGGSEFLAVRRDLKKLLGLGGSSYEDWGISFAIDPYDVSLFCVTDRSAGKVYFLRYVLFPDQSLRPL